MLKLGEGAGLIGSTHIPFADMDNEKVAALLDEFLHVNRLDGYPGEGHLAPRRSKRYPPPPHRVRGL